MKHPTFTELQELYDLVYLPAYNDTLKNDGIKKLNRLDSPENMTQSTFVLMYLLYYIGQVVSKKELTEAYTAISGKRTNDLQVARHIGTQLGYDVTNSRGGINGYRLNSLNKKPGFFSTRRNVEVTDLEWEQIKEDYDYCCATCGDQENYPTRYDSSKISKLQMGHINPNKSLTLDNIIPQCQECNTQYKDKFIFNKYGRVIGVNT